MLLKEIKNIFHKELDAIYPIEEVDAFFYSMIEHYLGLERFVLAIQPTYTLTKEEEQPLFEGLAQLKMEKPLQYILGVAHFMEMEFKVNPDVLIPRPETEELVRWILDGYSAHNKPLKILDIGTGSGCIAIALAKNLPSAKVYAMDISKEALEVAKENAVANGVEIHFMEADILKLEKLDEKFDIIVSNPPYVREMEKEEIKSNVKDNEPERALFVSNERPLVFYDKIIHLAKKSLHPNGAVFFEINQYLGKETRLLLEDQNFLEIELRKDMFGNDRMLKGIFAQ